MYVQYNDGMYYRPIIKGQNLGLSPYKVMRILTGNEHILYKRLLNYF